MASLRCPGSGRFSPAATPGSRARPRPLHSLLFALNNLCRPKAGWRGLFLKENGVRRKLNVPLMRKPGEENPSLPPLSSFFRHLFSLPSCACFRCGAAPEQAPFWKADQSWLAHSCQLGQQLLAWLNRLRLLKTFVIIDTFPLGLQGARLKFIYCPMEIPVKRFPIYSRQFYVKCAALHLNGKLSICTKLRRRELSLFYCSTLTLIKHKFPQELQINSNVRIINLTEITINSLTPNSFKLVVKFNKQTIKVKQCKQQL